MKYIILSFCLFISGCSTIDKSSLLMDLKEPQKLEDANATICEGNFFEVGFDCAELSGYPALTHPMFLMFFGCTVNWYETKNQVMKISRSVVFASSQWSLTHEIDHIAGKPDVVGMGIESQDVDTIKKYTKLALDIEKKYKEAGQCYELNSILVK